MSSKKIVNTISIAGHVLLRIKPFIDAIYDAIKESRRIMRSNRDNIINDDDLLEILLDIANQLEECEGIADFNPLIQYSRRNQLPENITNFIDNIISNINEKYSGFKHILFNEIKIDGTNVPQIFFSVSRSNLISCYEKEIKPNLSKSLGRTLFIKIDENHPPKFADLPKELSNHEFFALYAVVFNKMNDTYFATLRDKTKKWIQIDQNEVTILDKNEIQNFDQNHEHYRICFAIYIDNLDSVLKSPSLGNERSESTLPVSINERKKISETEFVTKVIVYKINDSKMDFEEISNKDVNSNEELVDVINQNVSIFKKEAEIETYFQINNNNEFMENVPSVREGVHVINVYISEKENNLQSKLIAISKSKTEPVDISFHLYEVQTFYITGKFHPMQVIEDMFNYIDVFLTRLKLEHNKCRLFYEINSQNHNRLIKISRKFQNSNISYYNANKFIFSINETIPEESKITVTFWQQTTYLRLSKTEKLYFRDNNKTCEEILQKFIKKNNIISYNSPDLMYYVEDNKIQIIEPSYKHTDLNHVDQIFLMKIPSSKNKYIDFVIYEKSSQIGQPSKIMYRFYHSEDFKDSARNLFGIYSYESDTKIGYYSNGQTLPLDTHIASHTKGFYYVVYKT